MCCYWPKCLRKGLKFESTAKNKFTEFFSRLYNSSKLHFSRTSLNFRCSLYIPPGRKFIIYIVYVLKFSWKFQTEFWLNRIKFYLNFYVYTSNESRNISTCTAHDYSLIHNTYKLLTWHQLETYIKDVKELSWMSHRVIRFWFLLNFLFISAFFDILASLSISRVFQAAFQADLNPPA